MPEDRRLVPAFTVEQNIRLPSWTVAMPDVEHRLAWIFKVMPELAALRARRALGTLRRATKDWWRSAAP